MNPAVLGIMIPIIALMIPIVAILVSHQQKMAQIIHSNRAQVPNHELEALRTEVRELKELIHQQAIAFDSLATRQSSATAPPPIQDRLQSGGSS